MKVGIAVAWPARSRKRPDQNRALQLYGRLVIRRDGTAIARGDHTRNGCLSIPREGRPRPPLQGLDSRVLLEPTSTPTPSLNVMMGVAGRTLAIRRRPLPSLALREANGYTRPKSLDS